MCEQLIYYCARTYRASQGQEEPQPADDSKDQSQKKVDDFLAKGKIQALDRVDENAVVEKKTKGKKKKETASGVVYEDDATLQHDFPMIQKFSKVQVSPPIDVDDLPKTEKQLQTLRDALKIRGQIEIRQNKAKLLKDETWTQGEEFEKMQAELEKVDEDIRKRMDAIKRDKQNWAQDDDGINVDEELDEEEIGMRLTKLKPERGDRRGFDGPSDRNRRGRSQGRPKRDNFEEERQERPRPQKRQERFNANKMEDFPEI
jgi:hypothetical protein